MNLYDLSLNTVIGYFPDKIIKMKDQEIPPLYQIGGNFTEREVLRDIIKDFEEIPEKLELIFLDREGHTKSIVYDYYDYDRVWIRYTRDPKLFHYHIGRRSGYCVAYSKGEVLVRLENNFKLEKIPEISVVPLEYNNARIEIIENKSETNPKNRYTMEELNDEKKPFINLKKIFSFKNK